MKRLFFPLTILLLGGFLMLSHKNKSLPENLYSEIDQIFKEWDSTESPGGVVGVIDKGELVFAKAYGMASLEYEVVNTTETVFNIASVSKQVTAYSLVLLEQQGKLSIDDDVRKYLPEVPDFGETITIRHLLTHTSGLRNFQNMLSMAGWRSGDPMTNDDLLRYIARQKELNFPVGEEYLYCNTGFNLATAIVERITDQTFQEWTKENIFDPLGMKNTGYREDMEVVHKNTATSYDGNIENGFRQPLKFWTYMGNGNVYTTIGDMAKWVNNFAKGKVGGEAGIARLQEEGVLNSGEKTSYGLGIGVGEYRGLRRLSHGGSIGGFRSNLIYFPEQEVGVVVLANFSSAGPGPKSMAVADLYLEKSFLEPKPKRNNNRLEHLSQAVDISKEAFDVSAGHYLVDGIHIELLRKGDQFFVDSKGFMPTLELKAASETSFFNKDQQISIFADKNDKEVVERLTILHGPERRRAVRIDPAMLETAALRKYTGTYYSPELDTRYTFVLNDGKLTAKHQRHQDLTITALKKDRLSADAYFFNDIDVEWEDDAVKGIRVSNGRVRDLWFEKID